VDGETLFWIIASGAATGLGGIALLVVRDPSTRTLDVMLGFTAGVMLAATAFSLLVPGLERGAVGEVTAGLLVGCAFLVLLDRVTPHEHERFREGGARRTGDARAASRRTPRERARLLLSALTIHNVPEGLAVGIAFGAGGTELGIPLALAIGIQNIPEGFAAAAPLLQGGGRAGRAAGVAALTGAVEPPAALAAYAAVEAIEGVLPFAFGFAAGAMLYVVVDELIPESHGHGFEREASLALVGGFALLMVLDSALG
jgi:ZIP family zinc transporter